MIKFILCIALGFAGHQTSPVFDLIEKRLNGRGMAWPRIGRYTVGGLLIRGSARIMLRGVSYGKDSAANADIIDGAIASGLIGVGAGVAAGYVLDMLKES